MNRKAILYALAAAALFGVSTPVAKLLAGTVDAWILAGLLYAGSGLGLGGLLAFRRRAGVRREAPIARRDLPWLAAAVLLGGIAGPVLLMIGLTRTDGATASLLLTTEGLATALLAWFIFGESFDRRLVTGMLLIVGGAAILAWQGSGEPAITLGALAVVGACVAWGFDNNFSRRISLADPVQIAAIKGLAAGPVTLILAIMLGAPLPAVATAVIAAVVGFLGYGLSLVLFVLALRHLGAARTGAYFSVAPFLGAASAVALLDESVTLQLLIAGGLMAAGVWLHLSERHEHEHEHIVQEHSHRHDHDSHHRHDHHGDGESSSTHVHLHRHGSPRHRHAHTPDAHHHHGH